MGCRDRASGIVHRDQPRLLRTRRAPAGSASLRSPDARRSSRAVCSARPHLPPPSCSVYRSHPQPHCRGIPDAHHAVRSVSCRSSAKICEISGHCSCRFSASIRVNPWLMLLPLLITHHSSLITLPCPRVSPLPVSLSAVPAMVTPGLYPVGQEQVSNGRGKAMAMVRTLRAAGVYKQDRQTTDASRSPAAQQTKPLPLHDARSLHPIPHTPYPVSPC